MQEHTTDLRRNTLQSGRQFGWSVFHELTVLCKVGLEYLSLGQPFDSLSGGELQRLKLVVELREPKPIYVLDEPTTGLHSKDIQMMCQADRIIDLGSGAGDEGGQLLFQGTPKDFFKCQKPVPAKYLQNFVKMNERLLRN